MQHSGIKNGLSAPPPPPPLPSKFQNSHCIFANEKNVKLSKRSPKDDVISALRHITYNFYVENPVNLVSLYYPISSVIQDGRCCGIVALSMASQLIQEVSVIDILNLAKLLKFTKEGEMFSAFNMSKLATSLLDCDAEVIENLHSHKDDILKHICDGWPILIPYDADKNHSPCSNNGFTAHWAVITGFCFTVSDKICLNTFENIEVINEFPELNIFVFEDKLTIKYLLKYSEKIFLYAHQGKSRHLAAWNFNDLLESNGNMFEVTKKYSPNQLVLPANDALSELRNKAVLLKKR